MLQLKLVLIEFEVFHGERKKQTSALSKVHTAGFHRFFTVNLSDT